jgi:hypothetical protein
MYGVVVICSKNGLYSQFWKEADFTPPRQILFTYPVYLLETATAHRPSLVSCLQAIIRLQKPIKFASCGLNRVLIWVTCYCR